MVIEMLPLSSCQLNLRSVGNSSLGSKNFDFDKNLNSSPVNPDPLLWLGLGHYSPHPHENINCSWFVCSFWCP